MEYAVLGHLEVRRDGAVLDLGTPLQRALLALLLVENGRPVSTDRIADALWGEAPPQDPAASVQTYVFRLRRLLEPGRERGAVSVLERTSTGYRLDVTAASVDAHRFQALAAQARRLLEHGAPDAAATAAAQALGLWRDGSALPELVDVPGVQPFRARLAEVRLACLEDGLAAQVALGRLAEALPELDALTAAHPYRERPWLLLMTALHRAGRTAEALERFQQVRQLLDEELGLQPGPALRDLQRRVLSEESGLTSEPVLESAGAAERTAVLTEPAGAPSRVPDDALVGRLREQAAIARVLGETTRSGLRVVLVEGEAGIGKSRLAREAVAMAGASGQGTAWATCHEDDDLPALWPWRRLLGALCAGAASAGPTESEAGMFAVFEQVATGLRLAAAARPLLLVIDDLQWADPTSLRLLAYLAVEARDADAALVLTCRSGPREEDLTRALSVVARSPGFTHLPLRGLSDSDSTLLVEGVLRRGGSPGMSREQLAALLERGGGNPFFTIELARLVTEDARLRTDRTALPPAVRETVGARLARLPLAVRAALHIAAVVGAEVDVRLLLRVSSMPPDQLLTGLDMATAAGLLAPTRGERLRFTHALVRETVLAEIGDLQRRRVHATIAAALPPTADVTERAHHLIQGRPFTAGGETSAAAVAAAETAAEQHAYDDAARWYDRALAVVDAEPDLDAAPHDRQSLLVAVGRMEALSGRRSAAQRHFAEAVDVALARDDATTAAAAAAVLDITGAGWFWTLHGAHPTELLGRLEATVAALGDEDSALLVRVLGTLATGSYYAPDSRTRDDTSARALAMARRLGDPDVVADALAERLAAIWVPATAMEQVALADELLDLLGPEASVRTLVALVRRHAAHRQLAEVDAAAADLARAWEITEHLRIPTFRRQLQRLEAAEAIASGDFPAAEEWIVRGSVLLEPEELSLLQAIDGVLRATILLNQGRLHEAPSAGGPVLEPDPGQQLLGALAEVHAGRPERARAAMLDNDLYRPLPAWWDQLSLTCLQAQVAADLGDPEAATAVLARLLPYAGQLAVHGTLADLGPVSRFVGRLELLAGRLDDAVRHLYDAVALAERHRLRPALAWSLLHLSEALTATGDLAGARDAVAASGALADELGMAVVAQQARASGATIA